MTQAESAQPDSMPVLPYETAPAARLRGLLRELLWLAIPVLAENVLHIFVGLNDTYLAGHLPAQAKDATAAVGLVTYVLWLIGLIAGAIGTGSTAIIARAVGAKHQRLANSVCGQSVMAAVIAGAITTVIVALFAVPITRATGLQPDNPAFGFSIYYLRILGLSLPFMMLMLAANACLRGAGDSVSPAIAMIVVDVVNVVFSFALTRGWWGIPVMGFRGIAIGTVIAYIAGGAIQFAVLFSGRGKIRLYLHRLRPHWLTMKRVLRIGIPNGIEGIVVWVAQFAILGIIFHIDPTNVQSAAHIVTIRIESLSFMCGLAFATAAATVVGQSLGMRDPKRAEHGAHLAFALAGGVMISGGICFILFRHHLAGILSDDPRIAELSAACLFITAFSQPGFAASLIYGSALRGAGDTLVVMIINLASILSLRFVGVIVVTLVLHHGLEGVWLVLAIELTLRGIFMYARFRQGGWKSVKV
ncbi:MAG TPA: MATE family efflux transporter [Tepidisphaeraceae bacterium]|jgi:putative MATE family efflux protein|nr:MATE family efflux transporter [Tepidisphaeraceae bacterium]